MTTNRTTRSLTLAALLTLASCCAPLAWAQRGPGGAPGGPGGGPGGGLGGGLGGPGGIGGAAGAPNNPNGPMQPGGNMGRGPANGGAPGPRYAPRLGPAGRWWDDKKFAKVLNLRTDQQKKMDDIFDAGKGNLFTLYGNLQREESRLGSLSSSDLADESKVFAAIDRVAQARADVEKANAHILLEIRKELDAGQVATLDREAASLR